MVTVLGSVNESNRVFSELLMVESRGTALC